MNFKFELNQRVTILESGEQGLIIGRAQYANGSEDAYLIRYKAGDGRAVEAWWSVGALI